MPKFIEPREIRGTARQLNKAQVILTNLFAQGYSQKDLSVKFGVSQGEISKVYTGKKINGTAYYRIISIVTTPTQTESGKFHWPIVLKMLVSGIIIAIVLKVSGVI